MARRGFVEIPPEAIRHTRKARKEATELMAAVGVAVGTWAGVELYLARLFRTHVGTDREVADTIWGTIVSFDARVSLLQGILAHSLKEKPVWEDIELLLNQTRRLYKRRNEIAHSTPYTAVGGKLVLEPFLIISVERPVIDFDSIQKTIERFGSLKDALAWLLVATHESKGAPKRPKASSPPLPDLVLELRAEESQRRKEQQERDQLLKTVRKLQKDGKWPPK
jgi:hypothetical protein